MQHLLTTYNLSSLTDLHTLAFAPLPGHIVRSGTTFRCKPCRKSLFGVTALLNHTTFNPSHTRNVANHATWHCAACAFQGRSQQEYDFHCGTQKHRVPKPTPQQLFCEPCGTQCRTPQELHAHTATAKHRLKTSTTE